MDFGRLLGPFWDPKRHQKINEILDAILDAKKWIPGIFGGAPGGMCRVPGGNNRGVQGCQNCRRDEDQGIRNSRIVSSTPSLVGRRIAPHIPPGWDSEPEFTISSTAGKVRGSFGAARPKEDYGIGDHAIIC